MSPGQQSAGAREAPSTDDQMSPAQQTAGAREAPSTGATLLRNARGSRWNRSCWRPHNRVRWRASNDVQLRERTPARRTDRHRADSRRAGLRTDRAGSRRASPSGPVAQLLADLGVTKTHSRPHVSNDNPLLRICLQDARVPPGFPRVLRLHRGRARLLRRLLRLVQRRALRDHLRDIADDHSTRFRRAAPDQPPYERRARFPSVSMFATVRVEPSLLATSPVRMLLDLRDAA